MTDKQKLIKNIKSWLKDYESTLPPNLTPEQDDSLTFEGSAYDIMLETLNYLNNEELHLTSFKYKPVKSTTPKWLSKTLSKS